MSKWNVGDRVQTDELVDGKPVFHVGTVTEVNEDQREAKRYDYTARKDITFTETYVKNIKVKWDDGEEELLDQYAVYREDTDAERQFRAVALEAGNLINEKLAIASKAIDEAEVIAEQYGVPFSAGVSPLGQSYFPASTGDKFPDVDSDFINDITGAYHSEYGGEGWQHSAVCY